MEVLTVIHVRFIIIIMVVDLVGTGYNLIITFHWIVAPSGDGL